MYQGENALPVLAEATLLIDGWRIDVANMLARWERWT